MKFRAFIAADVEPNESLSGVLSELKTCGADLKVVRPELLHLTLKFLGDIDEDLVQDVGQRMAQATEGTTPFVFKIKGLGAFPSMSNVRVIWAGIEDASPLIDISRKLDGLLAELGLDRDRKGFSAHVTLARARSGRGVAAVQEMLRRNAAAEYGQYPVDRIVLKKSVLSPQGPRYSVVKEQLLGPA